MPVSAGDAVTLVVEKDFWSVSFHFDHTPVHCGGTEWTGSSTYFQSWNNRKSYTLWRLHWLCKTACRRGHQ